MHDDVNDHISRSISGISGERKVVRPYNNIGARLKNPKNPKTTVFFFGKQT